MNMFSKAIEHRFAMETIDKITAFEAQRTNAVYLGQKLDIAIQALQDVNAYLDNAPTVRKIITDALQKINNLNE